MSSRQVSPARIFGRTIVRLWIFAVLFFSADFQASAQKIKVAVLGGEDTEPLRTVLTVECSKLPEVAMIERGELDKVAREQSLQTSRLSSAEAVHLGKLAHADMLLVLAVENTHPEASPNVARVSQTLRLIATEAGVALLEEKVELPAGGAAQWATITARRLLPYMTSFTAEAGHRIPLSVLKIRSEAGDFRAGHAEKELGRLLVRRLMHEPSLMVLERTQMGPLEWESALRADAASSFLTGSYLLDGSFTETAGKYSATARLRSPGGGPAINLKAEGADLGQLVESLTRSITTHLETKPADQPWDKMAEAQQYLDEAIWAFRWRLLDECVQSAESAWVLGLRNDSLGLLRCAGISARLSQSFFLYNPHVPEKPSPKTLEEASALCDYLSESLAWKGEDLSEAWVAVAANSLWTVSSVLRSYYYAPSLEPAEAEALAALRARVRTLSESLKPAAQRFPFPRLQEKESGLHDGYLSGAPFNLGLYILRGIAEPVWQESAREGAEKTRLLFDEIDALPPLPRRQIKSAILEDRPAYSPWIAYWHSSERSQVSFADLRKKLLDSPFLERPIDVALMVLRRHLEALVNHEKEPSEQNQVLLSIEEVKTAVANAITPIARGEIAEDRVSRVLGAMRDAENQVNNYAKPPIDAELKDFHLSTLKTLLAWHVADSNLLSIFSPRRKDLTQDEWREIYELALQATGGKRIGYVENLENNYLKGFAPKDAIKPATPAPVVALKPAWTVAFKDIIGETRLNSPRARAAGGQLWIFGQDVDKLRGGEANAVFQFDPQTRSVTRLPPLLNSMGMMSDLTLFQGDVLVLGSNSLQRFHRAENSWENIAIPAGLFAKMWVIKDSIYIGGNPGLICRFTPATNQLEILASSRRRPAITMLDDVPPYTVEKVFEDEAGRICTILDDKRICRWDEEKKTWDEVFLLKPPEFYLPKFVDGHIVREGSKDLEPADRSLYLHALGPDDFEAPSNGMQGLREFLIRRLLWRGPSQPISPDLRHRMPNYSLAPGNVPCVTIDGAKLWWVANVYAENRPFLQCLPMDGEIGNPIPLDIGQIHPGGIMDAGLRVWPGGLLIFAYPKFYFFRQEDIETRRVGH